MARSYDVCRRAKIERNVRGYAVFLQEVMVFDEEVFETGVDEHVGTYKDPVDAAKVYLALEQALEQAVA